MAETPTGTVEVATTGRRGAPRRARAAVLSGVALLLAGCGGGASDAEDDPPASTGGSPRTVVTPGTDDTVPGNGAPGGVQGKLHADVEVTPGGLVVTWSYWNVEDQPVYLANRAPGPAGPLSETSAYVVGLTDGGVQVSQRVFERPESDPNDYFAPFRVGVTKVHAGGTVYGDLVLDAPFEEVKPFDGYYADGEVAVPDDPTSVTFCVGVLVPPYSRGEVVDLGDDGPEATHGDTADQTVFCSRPEPLD